MVFTLRDISATELGHLHRCTLRALSCDSNSYQEVLDLVSRLTEFTINGFEGKWVWSFHGDLSMGHCLTILNRINTPPFRYGYAATEVIKEISEEPPKYVEIAICCDTTAFKELLLAPDLQLGFGLYLAGWYVRLSDVDEFLKFKFNRGEFTFDASRARVGFCSNYDFDSLSIIADDDVLLDSIRSFLAHDE